MVVLLINIAWIAFVCIPALADTSCTQESATQAETLTEEKWYEFNDGKECKITAYCLCRKCCGKNWEKALTASGDVPTRYVTVANGSLPFGTRIYIEGIGYRVVMDRGSAVGKTQFDVYVGEQNHQFANDFGVLKRKVWIVK